MTFERHHTKKILKIVFIVSAVILVLGYAIFVSRDFLGGPKIIINEPENGATLTSQTVIIRGNVMRSRDISLNGKPIFIDDSGNFKETTLLFPGYNTILIEAVDKFDRKEEYRLELVYKVN